MMNDLDRAYEILNSIPIDADKDTIFSMVKEAYEISNKCLDARIILSRCYDNFSDKEKILIIKDDLDNESIDKINYELASLYYEHGMFKKAKEIFESISDDNSLKKYKLMNIYALLEDKKINEYYKSLVNDIDEIEFVRLSFPYMIYLYKKDELDKSRKLFIEINKLNPDIKKTLNGEEVVNEEAYKVLKNNSILINSCPYIIKDLVI